MNYTDFNNAVSCEDNTLAERAVSNEDLEKFLADLNIDKNHALQHDYKKLQELYFMSFFTGRGILRDLVSDYYRKKQIEGDFEG